MPTANYGWDHIATNQASKEVTANGVFDAIDAQVKTNDTAAEHVSRLDTDGTLAANSDAKYPSQKAVKTYVDKKGPSIDDQTASYTAALADANNIVTMANASANNFTVPPNSGVAFPIGTTLTVIQKGAGQTTLVAGVGVTINTAATLTCRAQWSIVTLVQIAANVWVAGGDLT